MLLSYKECMQLYGNKYQLKKKLEQGDIYKLEKDIYAEQKYIPEYKIISKKYPSAIFTLNSAFYYHQLTDVIPERYYLATDCDASKINDPRVVQIFENSKNLELGAEHINYGGTYIYIYSKERMLVELLRNKNKLSFDYYKEILINYRKILWELDIQAIQDMALNLPKSQMIIKALQMEVF